MAQRVDTVTQHIFAFDDDEITVILNALYEAGHDELADEIFDEMDGECECEGCGQDVYHIDISGDISDMTDSLHKCHAINKFTEGR